MKKSSVLFFCFVTNFYFSQQEKVLVSNLKPKTENSVFPLVSVPLNNKVEEKINIFLQVSELENIPNTRKNPFQLALSATNSYTNYIYFYEWKMLQAPKNILSLLISGEATGAYPEGFIEWNNFDLRTGNYLNLPDIFDDDKIEVVQNIVNKKVETTILDFIASLKDKKELSDEEKEQMRMYQECLEYVNRKDLSSEKFYFNENNLSIVRERCSNHAMRAMDDLDTFTVDFPITKLSPYLNAFGKYLLLQSNKESKQENIQNKLYKGKIAKKYPITVLIKNINEDGSFSAVYWYNNTRKLINWSGEISNNHLSITEDDTDEENAKNWIPKANVEADIKGNKIIGTWQDFKTKKHLTLELEEY